jgi:hypothetical protein
MERDRGWISEDQVEDGQWGMTNVNISSAFKEL